MVPFAAALLFLINSLIGLLIYVVILASWLVIITAVLSWLVAFDVINLRNSTIYRIVRALDAVTEPMLRPIRRFLPNLGGIDISPIILLLLLRLALIPLLQALRILFDGLLAPYAGVPISGY